MKITKKSNNKNYGQQKAQEKKDNKLWLLEEFKNLTEKKIISCENTYCSFVQTDVIALPKIYDFSITSIRQVFPVFITGIQMMRGQLT
jgi:hypothetical protein